MPAVPGDAQVAAPAGRCRHRFGIPEDLAGLLVNRRPPEVHRAVAVAREVQVVTVGRPDGIPVHGGVIRDRDRTAPRGTRGRDRPDVALTAAGRDRPVGDAMSVGGPVRLDRVSIRDRAFRAGRDVDGPEPARGLPGQRRADALIRNGDLVSIGGPGRVEAEVSQPADGFARGAHQEDAATFPFRPERDLAPVGREGRLCVVLRRVLRQVDRVAAVHTLQEDVRVAGGGTDVDERLAVRRDAREVLYTGLQGQLREHGSGSAATGDALGGNGSREAIPSQARRDDRADERRGDSEEKRRATGPDPRVDDGDVRRRRPRLRDAEQCLQVEREVVRGVEPLLRALLQAVTDDPIERRGNVLIGEGGVRRLLAQDRRHRVGGRVAEECTPSGEHLVQHRSEGEDVGTRVGRLSPDLLGRHVADGPHHDAWFRSDGLRGNLRRRAARLFRTRQFRQPEVEDFDPSVLRDEQVLGFQVPVHDPFLVRGRERARDLCRVVERLAHRQTAAGKSLPQGLPFEELRDDVWSAVLQAEVVDRQNPGMVQRRRRTCLPLEPA